MIEYTWKDKHDTLTHFGYVAQEVKQIYPNQVQTNADGYLSVNYTEILVKKVNDLELKLQELENQILKLKKNK